MATTVPAIAVRIGTAPRPRPGCTTNRAPTEAATDPARASAAAMRDGRANVACPSTARPAIRHTGHATHATRSTTIASAPRPTHRPVDRESGRGLRDPCRPDRCEGRQQPRDDDGDDGADRGDDADLAQPDRQEAASRHADLAEHDVIVGRRRDLPDGELTDHEQADERDQQREQRQRPGLGPDGTLDRRRLLVLVRDVGGTTGLRVLRRERLRLRADRVDRRAGTEAEVVAVERVERVVELFAERRRREERGLRAQRVHGHGVVSTDADAHDLEGHLPRLAEVGAHPTRWAPRSGGACHRRGGGAARPPSGSRRPRRPSTGPTTVPR